MGNIVRLACPLTCGCADPTKGQLHGHEMYGCPSVCRYKFKKELVDMDCVDVADDDAGLAMYMRSYEHLFDYDKTISSYANAGKSIPVSCSSWSSEAQILHSRNWSIGSVSACDPSSA